MELFEAIFISGVSFLCENAGKPNKMLFREFAETVSKIGVLSSCILTKEIFQARITISESK